MPEALLDSSAPARPALPRAALLRVIKDVLRAELKARSALQFTEAQAAAWDEATELGSPALPVDSLELVSITGRINQLFHLHEAGVEEGLLARPRLGEWVDLVAGARGGAGGRWTFLTSGSTGVPKPCEHESALLWQEIDAWARLFARVERIVTLAPTNHLYGFLFGVLLGPGMDVPTLDARALGPAALAGELGPGDLLVGVPLHLEYVARSVASLAGARVVVSTGPLDGPTAEQLGHLGAGPITEIFGSTETGGIGHRRVVRRAEEKLGADARAEPFTLLDYWRPTPEDPSRLVRRRPDGALGEPVTPMDRLVFDAAGRFTLGGRVDAAVKVGGLNVFPRRIERTLAEHPGVAECRVRLMRPDEGERLKAFIVPTLGATHTEHWEEHLRGELRAFCRERLTAAERPRTFAFGPALPLNTLGKPADW